jgi:hypothetical protein
MLGHLSRRQNAQWLETGAPKRNNVIKEISISPVAVK